MSTEVVTIDFDQATDSLKKVTALKEYIAYCPVETPEQANSMLSQGANAKKLYKELDTLRKEILKPAREFEEKVSMAFKPFLRHLESIEALVKAKISTYEDNARKQALNANLEHRCAMALSGLGEVSVPVVEPEKVAVGNAQIIKRRDWKFDVQDEALVPREYLTIDEDKVKALIKAGIRTIPGLRIYEVEKSILRSC